MSLDQTKVDTVTGMSGGGRGEGFWNGTNFTNGEMDSLLNDPNTASPANVEASNLYKENRREYTKRVRETVEKSWES